MEAVDGYRMYAVRTDGENNDHVMMACVIILYLFVMDEG